MNPNSDKTILLDNNVSLSFNALFGELYSSLCLFSERFLVSTVHSEDLVQEVFLKLWDKFEDFDSVTALKAYLYQSTRNSCLNHIRHEKVKRKYESERVHEVQEQSFFLQQVVEEESSRIIAQSIEELPTQCQNILQLSINGLKNQEIAEDLGISINSVKTQKNIAYKKLRHKLQHVFDIIFHIMYM